MLYGQLNEFGDAEVAALIAPRPLDITYDPNGPIPPLSVKEEAARAQRVYNRLNQGNELAVIPDSGAYLGLVQAILGEPRSGLSLAWGLQTSPDDRNHRTSISGRRGPDEH